MILAFAAFAALAGVIGLWDHLSYERSFVELDRTLPSASEEPATQHSTEKPANARHDAGPPQTVPATNAPATDAPAPAPATEAAPDFPIELNAATLEDLCAIPGVGEVTAQHILEHRSCIGGFTSLEQLLDVTGIGDARYHAMLPYLRLEASAPEPADAVQEAADAAPEPADDAPAWPPDPTEPPESAQPATEPPRTDAPATEPPAPPAQTEAETQPLLVDLNTADTAALCRLPDCSEEIAAHILALREEIGQFSNILEINYAEGVTRALYTQWEPFLVLDEEGHTELPRIIETVSPVA